ncbi:lysophospholipid acyltransferase family protein [Sulfurovum sp. XTW-4]|uniref:Lysophospholipid acyltransferase family protein n=1 Tax=Sulfurovum xiamenensis TaxID=3019066 RepID=A0ABT7QPD9_9BACT|nr:lysophospholipid acyltransferase family protein [Sulfurovum xiamenensis]MDM5262933.1 lysophospholipid acyltransferase family protein [Sulfurovum xiamenensis]
MREKIEYAFVRLFLWLAKIAPTSFIYMMMKALTLLVYHVDKKRRHLTITNLAMAFPEKTPQEIVILSKEVYRELSKTITEILLMFTGKFDIDNAIKNREEVKEKLQELAQNSPHGIVFMTAHFSNWELMAHFIAKNGLPMIVIGRKGNNRLIESNITTPFREKYGNSAASKDKAMLSMMKKLKAKGNVGLLIDQKSGGSHSAKIDFFGKPAETTLSVASLKLKLDPLIVPVFVVRGSDGLYELVINAPVEYVADEIEDQQKKLEAMTLKYNQAIEDVVRKYPSQWFWMHNRWRL